MGPPPVPKATFATPALPSKSLQTTVKQVPLSKQDEEVKEAKVKSTVPQMTDTADSNADKESTTTTATKQTAATDESMKREFEQIMSEMKKLSR